MNAQRKSIIITGAANGIGKAITRLLIAEGYHIYALDVDEAGLTDLEAERIVLNVSDYDKVAKFFEGMDTTIYGLVNCAGIFYSKKLLDYDEQLVNNVIDVNLKGAIYMSRAFYGHVKKSGGKSVIVNISSVTAHCGSNDVVYGASKAGLLGLTKSCALHFAPDVRVNAVAPSLVDTKLIENVSGEILQQYRGRELLEAATAEDVAKTVAFLFSANARHYTGAVFDLNNGYYFH